MSRFDTDATDLPRSPALSLESNDVIHETDDVLPDEVVHDDDDRYREDARGVRQSDRLEGVHAIQIEADDAEHQSQREAQRDNDERQQRTMRAEWQWTVWPEG